jgi:hypothetical protein
VEVEGGGVLHRPHEARQVLCLVQKYSATDPDQHRPAQTRPDDDSRCVLLRTDVNRRARRARRLYQPLPSPAQPYGSSHNPIPRKPYAF